jgi:hypothetical protein
MTETEGIKKTDQTQQARNTVVINVETEGPQLPKHSAPVHAPNQVAVPAASSQTMPSSQSINPAGARGHSHKRTASGLELKESYQDDELDDDWYAIVHHTNPLLHANLKLFLTNSIQYTACYVML